MIKKSLCSLMAVVLTILLFIPMTDGQTAYADGSGEPAPEEELPGDLDVPSTDGDGAYSYLQWYDAAKAEAQKADHILGPDGDLMKNNWTVILPGETIAVLPGVSFSNNAIQGGISGYYATVYELINGTVNTDYMVDSAVPSNAAFTQVEQDTVSVPYADRLVDKPNDPVSGGVVGMTQYSYVSLYRNDTGFPILLRKNPTAHKRATLSSGGKNSNGYTNFQSDIYVYDAPTLFFMENTYDITLGRYKIGNFGWNAIGDNLIWAKSEAIPKVIYIDGEDHTYSFPAPLTKGAAFKKWDICYLLETASVETAGNTTNYTFNFADYVTTWTTAALREDYLKDESVDAVFDEAYTTLFYARGGTIDGTDSFFLTDKVNSSGLTTDVNTVVPTCFGCTFSHWENNLGNPVTADRKDSSLWTNKHMDVYAVWSYTVGDVDGKGDFNTLDLVRAASYISGEDCQVNTVAFDRNADGQCDLIDLVSLMKALAAVPA